MIHFVFCDCSDFEYSVIEQNKRSFLIPNEEVHRLKKHNSELEFLNTVISKIASILEKNSGKEIFVDLIFLRTPKYVQDLTEILKFSFISELNLPIGTASKKIIGLLISNFSKVRKIRNIISKEFKERDSKTSILLPKCYGSREFVHIIQSVYRYFCDNIRNNLDINYEEFRLLLSDAERKLKTRRVGGKSYFSDSRDYYYKAPSVAGPRHAFARRQSGPHGDFCFVSAFLRLGASYRPNFHYDVTAESGGIKAKFENCHGDDESVTRPSYVNIAPNGFIR
jgi:hypothetical protein